SQDFTVDLESGKFDRYSFSRAQGRLSVYLDEIKLDKDFKIWYKNTEVVGEGRIGYTDSLSIKGSAVFNDLRDFTGQTFIRDIKGRGVFRFTASGPLTDFALEGDFESDSIWGYELFSSNLKSNIKIDKFISRRGGDINLLLLDGSAWGIPYDSLSSVILLEKDSVTIEPTRLSNEWLSLIFHGDMEISSYPQVLRFEEIKLDYRGNKIESAVPARIEIDKDEVRFTDNSFKTEEGEFSIKGRIDYQERMKLTLDVNHIQISPWARLLLPSKRIAGWLDAALKFEGMFKEPQLNLYSEIRDLYYENVDLGFFSGNLSYKEKQLSFDKISLLHPDGDYLLSGYMPFDLSFSPVSVKLQDEPQNIVLKGEGNKFSLIHILIPEVEYLQGKLKGSVNITGTPLHPVFEGSTELSSGTLKLVPFRNTLTQVQAKLRMKNENIFIDEISGVSSHEEISQENILKKIWHLFFPRRKIKGEVLLQGNINMGDIKKFKYNLYLNARDLPLSYEYANLIATTDLNLEINGQDPPLVSGEIIFSHLAFKDPFNTLIQNRAGPPIPRENLWDLELVLSGANNLWVLNQDMQTEFKGEIQLSRKEGDLKLLGNLETIRGKHFIYGTTFKIKKGEFIFDDIQKIDPKLDFLVSASLRGTAYSSKDSAIQKNQELELSIGGTLSAPEIKPATDSPYSKEEIAELLTFHQSFSKTESGESSIFQYRLAGSLGEAYANRFIENLATRNIGVETFEIKPLEPGKFSLLESEVTVGKYLSDKIYFRYTRRLSEATGQEAGMEYYLGKRFYLEAFRDKQGFFHLGLNLFWEY
ncbi:MAG: translocation/assembly module TamB, partial [candidate division Zixibacteria bacterium]|nr:translocation/assembly module TamB [candidate division Zixibacteria bacterium]